MNKFSKKNWEQLNLSNACLEAITELKFTQPTDIQSAVIPAILEGKMISAVSKTGSGKTLSYLLPLWELLKKSNDKCLILVPTRELALQVTKMITQISSSLTKNTTTFIGGENLKTQLAKAKGSHFFIVGTPGRIIDASNRFSKLLIGCKYLVLDEFDKLLKLGFVEQIKTIQQKLPRHKRFYLSATAPDDKQLELGKNGVFFNLDPDVETQGNQHELLYFLKSGKIKNKVCTDILTEYKKNILVFVKNRSKANHLNGLLKMHGWNTKTLHGKLSQKVRTDVLNEFMLKKFPILIATDLAARGLDTLHVELVLNFDLPRNEVDYVHRKGRTGRLGKKGMCISLAGPEDFLAYRNIEKGLQYEIPNHPDFSQKEKWLSKAKAKHNQKVTRDKKKDEIRREQKL